MKIQGRDCTLTVAKDGDFIPLPYSEETVRQTSKGYGLPGVIGRRMKECRIETGKMIQGCFVTRLEYLCTAPLFLLLFYQNEKFDLYADRVHEKIIYKNLNIKSFELRGDNKEAFKMRIDVEGLEDSYTENWPLNIPNLDWTRSRTYYFDGHNVIADSKVLPLVYRFELSGKYDERAAYKVKLYFPLSEEQNPVKHKIDKLSIVIDVKDGVSIDLYDLEPDSGLCDINCADTVLCNQSFSVDLIVFNIRNQKERLEVLI